MNEDRQPHQIEMTLGNDATFSLKIWATQQERNPFPLDINATWEDAVQAGENTDRSEVRAGAIGDLIRCALLKTTL
ncbi:MAG: hypothetical protein AAF633_00735, partial [Chloroflexota bacterium]